MIKQFFFQIQNNKMQNQFEETFGSKLHITSGVNYAVTLSWWEDFCFFNSQVDDLAKVSCSAFNAEGFVDGFLEEWKGTLVNELEAKCNYVKFSNIVLSPRLNSTVSWKLLPPFFTHTLKSKASNFHPILTFSCEADPLNLDNVIQVQIIFCSKTKSDAFIGFVPETSSIGKLVREVGYQLGFIEVQNSKVLFPDRNVDDVYFFQQLQLRSLKDAPDTIIMAFNMECSEDNVNFQVSFKLLDSSVEGVAGDLGMISNENSWSMFDDAGAAALPSPTKPKITRIHPLLSEKTPEEIQELSEVSVVNIKGELIVLPNQNDQFENCLETEALKLLSSLPQQQTFGQ